MLQWMTAPEKVIRVIGAVLNARNTHYAKQCGALSTIRLLAIQQPPCYFVDWRRLLTLKCPNRQSARCATRFFSRLGIVFVQEITLRFFSTQFAQRRCPPCLPSPSALSFKPFMTCCRSLCHPTPTHTHTMGATNRILWSYGKLHFRISLLFSKWSDSHIVNNKTLYPFISYCTIIPLLFRTTPQYYATALLHAFAICFRFAHIAGHFDIVSVVFSYSGCGNDIDYKKMPAYTKLTEFPLTFEGLYKEYRKNFIPFKKIVN